MEIARLVLGVLLLVAFALLTVQLYNGRWLFLIAKPREDGRRGTFLPPKEPLIRESARHG